MTFENIMLGSKKLDFKEVVIQLNKMKSVDQQPHCGWGIRTGKSVLAMNDKQRLQIEFYLESVLNDRPLNIELGYQEEDVETRKMVAFYKPQNINNTKNPLPLGEITTYEKFIEKYVDDIGVIIALDCIMEDLVKDQNLNEEMLFNATNKWMESTIYDQDNKKILYTVSRN